MSRTPLASVGIPVFNGARWIAETVESVLTQTVNDLELVICDNASTDDTEAICRDFAQRDARIRYIRNAENIGAPQNYNLCFERSAGCYFKWNSSSDLCRPTLLAQCIEVLENDSDAVLCYPGTQLLDDDGQLEDVVDDMCLTSADPSERFIELVKNLSLNHMMNGVIRREQLVKTPLHQPFYVSDKCLMAELVLHGTFVQLPERLFIRRSIPATASSLMEDSETRLYFDPQLESKMLFQRTQLLLGYFRAVRRAPISSSEKRKLYRYLLQTASWWRKILIREAVVALKSGLGRA